MPMPRSWTSRTELSKLFSTVTVAFDVPPATCKSSDFKMMETLGPSSNLRLPKDLIYYVTTILNVCRHEVCHSPVNYASNLTTGLGMTFVTDGSGNEASLLNENSISQEQHRTIQKLERGSVFMPAEAVHHKENFLIGLV
ncbi:uncharacterized protein LOC144365855 isoform X2 [Ictidomys tridecemlineatus]